MMNEVKNSEKCEDQRIRQNIFPTKVIFVKGCVENANNLCNEKELQIGLSEQNLTVLKNNNDGVQAGVLLDFGKEINGTIRLISYWNEGTDNPKVRITYGESVSEAMSEIGEKGASNDHAVRDIVVEIPSLSDMSFSETGFRFVYVQLLGENIVLSLKAITAIFIYRDIEYLGSFECNDELLNKIYDVSAYTCHLNMQNYLYDGIKRDRLVWIGDMHPEMLTIKTVFGSHSIIEDSLQFIQRQTKLPDWMNGLPTYSMWWLIILYDWYWYTGDIGFIDKNKEYIVELIKQIIALVNDDGSDNITDYFFDWPTRDTKASIDGVRSILVLALQASEKILNLYTKESKNLILAKDCLKKIKCLQTKKPEHFGAKQTAAFLSLAGMLDTKETSDLVLTVEGANGMSTFMSYYILKAVSLGGGTKEALLMLREYYGGMLELGATTFWEDFDIGWLENASRIDQIVEEGKVDVHGDKGAHCYKGFRHSLCHGWSSAPTAFLAETVLGVQILEPGCKKIKISPKLGELKWAKGTFPTPFGIIKLEHIKNTDGKIITTIDAPEEIELFLS